MEQQWNDIDKKNWRTRRKTCPSATLSTVNPTWTDLGTNPGLCSEQALTTWALARPLSDQLHWTGFPWELIFSWWRNFLSLWNTKVHNLLPKSLPLNLSQPSPVHTSTSSLSLSHLRLGLPNYLIRWYFSTKAVSSFLIFPMFNTHPAHFIFIDLRTLTIGLLGEQYKLRSPSLRIFLL
jgi:hypothetical protein